MNAIVGIADIGVITFLVNVMLGKAGIGKVTLSEYNGWYGWYKVTYVVVNIILCCVRYPESV